MKATISAVDEKSAARLDTTCSLGRLKGRTRRDGETPEPLAAIHRWFTEGFETADLRSARALLDRLA